MKATNNLRSWLGFQLSLRLEVRSIATKIYTIMAAGSRDSQNKIIQRKLQAVVLRAAVGGYIIPIESAIHVCVTQFNEGKSNPKDILDAFPEDLDVKVCLK